MNLFNLSKEKEQRKEKGLKIRKRAHKLGFPYTRFHEILLSFSLFYFRIALTVSKLRYSLTLLTRSSSACKALGINVKSLPAFKIAVAFSAGHR
jgi:hypothetical protein